jgi:hypothetical protein
MGGYKHPRWQRHFTPKHASWLNQIECWFGQLKARVLERGSFATRTALKDAVLDYRLWYDEHAEPFEWTYRPKSLQTKPALAAGGRCSHSRAVGVGRRFWATRTSCASRSCSRPEPPSTKAHARIKKASRSAVANLRTAWKKREEELQIPTQNTAGVLVEAHLSLPVVVPREQAATETNASEIEARADATRESSSERGDSVPGRVSEDALRALQGERALYVQHLGACLLVAMAARLGLHRSVALAGDGEVNVRALRVVLDAVMTAQAIGEGCVEGLRRIETPTANVLLRSERVPTPSEARALLSKFAEGHVGTAPLRLQYAMMHEYAQDEDAHRDRRVGVGGIRRATTPRNGWASRPAHGPQTSARATVTEHERLRPAPPPEF